MKHDRSLSQSAKGRTLNNYRRYRETDTDCESVGDEYKVMKGYVLHNVALQLIDTGIYIFTFTLPFNVY